MMSLIRFSIALSLLLAVVVASPVEEEPTLNSQGEKSLLFIKI
jgi:hypothetical protein